jgi:hypothetical protein
VAAGLPATAAGTRAAAAAAAGGEANAADEPAPAEAGEVQVEMPENIKRRILHVEEAVRLQHQRRFRCGELQRPQVVSVLQERHPQFDETSLPHWPIKVEDLCDTSVLRFLPDRARRSAAPTPVTSSELKDAYRLCAFILSRTLPRLCCPQFTICQGKKNRLIFDLRTLNWAVWIQQMKMETVFDVPAFTRGCKFGGVVDLRKGYWQVPVEKESSSWLGFELPRDLQEELGAKWATWSCLPFGLSAAPAVFQKITSSFAAAWRARGIRVMVYLDDFLIVARTLEEYTAAVEIVVADLLAAGWRLAPEKVRIRPHSTVKYLGLLVDLTGECYRLPPTKRTQLTAFAAAGPRLMSRDWRYELETFIGRATFACVVFPAATFFLPACRALVGILIPRGQRDDTIDVDAASADLLPEVAAELEWWSGSEANELLTTGARRWWTNVGSRVWSHRLPPQTPDQVARADASDTGVGVSVADARTGRVLLRRAVPLPAAVLRQPDATAASSTAREIYGIAIGLSFVANGATVAVVCDNVSAIATANARGCTRGTAWAARLMLSVILRKGLVVTAEWAPRDEMDSEDFGSRISAQSAAHAQVPLEYLRSVSSLYHPARPQPTLDAFAAVHNAVARRWGSRWPVPGSAGDGLSLDWGSETFVWCFPPFTLTRAVIKKALSAEWSRGQIMLLLPDDEWTRFVLRENWWAIPGPVTLMAPPAFTRSLHPSRPLVLFVSR